MPRSDPSDRAVRWASIIRPQRQNQEKNQAGRSDLRGRAFVRIVRKSRAPTQARDLNTDNP